MNLMGLKVVTCLLLVHYAVAKYGSDCVTNENEIGKKIPIKSCKKTYTMARTLLNMTDVETYNRTVSLLQQLHRGYENGMPLVCCLTTDIQMNPEIYDYMSQLHCGEGINHRIAYGGKAEISDFRWMALLAYDRDNSTKFLCGGSLIAERYVLTAAHCFREIPVAVRLGEYDLSSETDCIPTKMGQKCIGPYEDVGIEKIHIPDDYVYRDLHHDIALIRLVKPVTFQYHIRSICLPITKELQSSQSLNYQVAGWGRTERIKPSSVLLYTSIPHRDRDFCRERLRLPLHTNLTIGHICAGGERLRDSCKGDSGGPIFHTDIFTDGVARYVQIGIVSMGIISCGEVSLPSIYTNVSHYMQWITDHMSIS